MTKAFVEQPLALPKSANYRAAMVLKTYASFFLSIYINFLKSYALM